MGIPEISDDRGEQSNRFELNRNQLYRIAGVSATIVLCQIVMAPIYATFANETNIILLI